MPIQRRTAPIVQRVQRIGIQLAAKQARVPDCPPVPECTPAITGLQWCRYANPLFLAVEDIEAGTFTWGVTAEEPTCESEDIAIVTTGNVVPEDQRGVYQFSLTGELCDCVPTWTYQWGDGTGAGPFVPWLDGKTFVLPIPSGAPVGVVTISATCGGEIFERVLVISDSYY